ncbi:hypothetical protein KUH32_03215 [Thalassococcus sp. CAU 1522]|uniref:Transporter n=1 Tax=Thalassococcus arenae TaxID=2851652 RepID=A0ABS6N437_9RHOB|nr:hypothetical protein [Thalassococcus arenae]MBV2358771.1 hypothetical protein [Thalassococcus arenae]
MRLLLVIVAWMFCAAELWAGAWPQPAGSGFSSTSVELGWPRDRAARDPARPNGRYTSLFFEYGVTDRLTLGLDLGRDLAGRTKAVAFARLPLRRADTGPRVAVEMGLGKVGDDAVLRTGLSLGYGLANGWLAADLLADIGRNGLGSEAKLDLTWGRNLAHDRKLMLQLHAAKPALGDATLRVAPSLVTPLGGSLMLQTGLVYGLSGDETAGIRLGIWAKF